MKFSVEVNGRTLHVGTTPDGLTVNGRALTATLEQGSGRNTAALRVDGQVLRLTFSRARSSGDLKHLGSHDFTIWAGGERFRVTVSDARALELRKLALAAVGRHVVSAVVAPMPGLVVKVNVSVGEAVTPGQGLVVMEAMKMENELRAVAAGVVSRVHARPGFPVEKGTLLVEFE